MIIRLSKLLLIEVMFLFSVKQITNPLQNLPPLYAASESCTEEFLRCPDSITNENQIAPPLVCNSQFPFYALESLTKSLPSVHDHD